MVRSLVPCWSDRTVRYETEKPSAFEPRGSFIEFRERGVGKGFRVQGGSGASGVHQGLLGFRGFRGSRGPRRCVCVLPRELSSEHGSWRVRESGSGEQSRVLADPGSGVRESRSRRVA